MFTDRSLLLNSPGIRESGKVRSAGIKRAFGEVLFRLFFGLFIISIAPGVARAEVTFVFTYFDSMTNPNTGFFDPVLGPARRASLEAVAADIGSRIGQTATVRIGVAPSELDGTGFIGTASQTVLNAGPPAAGVFDGEVYRRIVLGLPYVGPAQDAGMAFDFGYPGIVLSGVPGPGEIYMPDVFRHELTHLLGFGSFIRNNGRGRNNTTPDVYNRFDTFLETSGGTPLIDSGGNLQVTTEVFDAEYAAGVFFDGPMTRAANGDAPLQLYFSDTTHSADPSDVMYVSPAVGFVRDAWTARDIGVLMDLGYTIVEPSPDGPGITLRKAKRFPTLSIGKARTQSILITNSGDEPLTGLGSRISGKAARDFKARAPVAKTLAPGASTISKVTFRPRAAGVRKATLTVRGNAPPQRVILTGKGKAKPK